MRLKNNRTLKIAILGVDGAGKSSLAESLSDYFKLEGQCTIYKQYMGFGQDNNFVFPWSQKILLSSSNRVYRLLAYWIEMYIRLHINKNVDILIYDRYSWDLYLQSQTRNFLFYLKRFFFKYLLPKPDICFYLFCPVEISLQRKKDIVDRVLFENMKQIYDDELLGKVFSIDTQKESKKTTLEKMISVIKEARE